jgi:hypothetical protein
MYSTVYNEVSGKLDSRFLLTIWFPNLLFWASLLWLALIACDLTKVMAEWRQIPSMTQLFLIALALAWVTFFSYLLSTRLGLILDIFSGSYWERSSVGRALFNQRKKYYQQIIKKLYADGNYAVIYETFPPYTRIEGTMPTRLGNRMENISLYPWIRYKMDATLIWPRLYSSLPDRMVRNLGEAKAALDLMLTMSTLGIAFALSGGAISLFFLPWWYFPTCLWLGIFVAWLGYEGACRSMHPYAQLVKTSFDLHRNDLLKTIGWAIPNSYDEEKQRWEQIGHLWYRGSPQLPEGAQILGHPPQKTEQNDDNS